MDKITPSQFSLSLFLITLMCGTHPLVPSSTSHRRYRRYSQRATCSGGGRPGRRKERRLCHDCRLRSLCRRTRLRAHCAARSRSCGPPPQPVAAGTPRPATCSPRRRPPNLHRLRGGLRNPREGRKVDWAWLRGGLLDAGMEISFEAW
jgi:hypothetical protein